MKIRQLLNKKGMTLVELLAALSLFAVVIALSSTVIIQMVGSKEISSSKTNLTQNSNVLVSQLRNQYTQKVIETEDKKTAVILSYKAFDRLRVTQVIANYGKSNEKKLSIDNGIIHDVPKQDTLPVKITTKNLSGDSITIETSWVTNNKDLVINISTSNGSNMFDKKQDFKDLIELQADSFIIGKTLTGPNQNVCDFFKNTKFKQGVMDTYKACDNTLVDANTWIPGAFKINDVNLTIKENLYAESSFLFHNRASLHTLGGARFDGQLKATGNNKINVDGYFFAEDEVILYNKASISIIKDALFESGVELQSTASITVNGNAQFQNSVHLQNNVKIIIEGNAQFDGPVGPNSSEGSICVKGEATFNSTVGNNLKIKENANSCK